MPLESPADRPAFDRALVVANPCAGNSRRRLDSAEALARVAPLGKAAQLGLTEAAGHATELAAEWAAQGHDLVVAVGGDGTVHEVAAGLMGTECAMAVLPSGSGDDFAAGVGCPTVARGLNAIARGQNVAVDVCELDDLIFVNSCGLFASGLVSGRAARYWRWLGSGRYSLAALRTLLSYQGQDVAWTFAVGAEISTVEGPILMAEICNGPLTGGGFRFAPDASLTDGLVDAALIKPLGALAGLKLLPAAAAGERLDHPALLVRQAREITFESAVPVAYHVDGEAAVLPAGRHRIRVRPEKLIVRMMPEA